MIFNDPFDTMPELKFYNGIMFFGIIMIIIDNVLELSLYFGNTNYQHSESNLNSIGSVFFFSNSIGTESVFFMLAFIRMTHMLQMYYSQETKTTLYPFKILIMYFLRTWVPLMCTVIYGISVLYYWGGGPMYEYSFDKFVWNEAGTTRCALYWWSPMFYLGSIYPSEVSKECFNWLWLISAEFFNFLTLLIVFSIYRKSKKFAYYFVVFMFFACMVSIAAIAIYNGYDVTAIYPPQ